MSDFFGLQNGLHRVYILWIVNEKRVSRVGLSSPYGLQNKKPTPSEVWVFSCPTVPHSLRSFSRSQWSGSVEFFEQGFDGELAQFV